MAKFRHWSVGGFGATQQRVIYLGKVTLLIKTNWLNWQTPTGASWGMLGYAYTHKPVAPFQGKVSAAAAVLAANRKAIRKACNSGFMISISANHLGEADKLAKYGLPMVSVVPANTPAVFTTPKGLHGIICPAQTRGLTCLQCKLCARPERAKSMPGTAGSMIIGFKPHGPGAKKVEALLSKECS